MVCDLLLDGLSGCGEDCSAGFTNVREKAPVAACSIDVFRETSRPSCRHI